MLRGVDQLKPKRRFRHFNITQEKNDASLERLAYFEFVRLSLSFLQKCCLTAEWKWVHLQLLLALSSQEPGSVVKLVEKCLDGEKIPKLEGKKLWDLEFFLNLGCHLSCSSKQKRDLNLG